MEPENAIDHLKQTIERACGPMPEDDWTAFTGKLEFITRPKGAELLSQGAYAKDLWYVVKGAARNVEYDGPTEKTYRFFVEGDFFINFKSILSNSPSQFTFVCEEDCELFRISYTDVLELYDRSHYFERTGRLFVQMALVEEMNYRRMLLNMNATQRYNYLMEMQPDIFHRFMLKHIASMLGVTPVSLSRLRSNHKNGLKKGRPGQ